VRGLIQACLHSELKGRILDLGTGHGTPLSQAVILIRDLLDSPIAPGFGALPDRVSENSQIADRVATRKLLPWEPLWSLKDGLKCTLDWYRDTPEFWRTAALAIPLSTAGNAK